MLRIYGVALKMLEVMRPAIEEIEKKDRDLARQMRRAGSSVAVLRQTRGGPKYPIVAISLLLTYA